MLPKHYRLTAKNETGQTIAATSIEASVVRWKLDGDGALVFEATAEEILSNGSTVANNAYDTGDAQDNDADGGWMGGHGRFEVTAPASSSGSVILYFEASDDGSAWPDNGLGQPVATLQFTTSGTKKIDFAI